MALPMWMRGRAAVVRDRRDMWNGQPLQARNVASDVDLHYRIYNPTTGELLSFGSNGGPGSLNGIVQDALRTQAEHPGVRLYVEQFDGPAYPKGGE